MLAQLVGILGTEEAAEQGIDVGGLRGGLQQHCQASVLKQPVTGSGHRDASVDESRRKGPRGSPGLTRRCHWGECTGCPPMGPAENHHRDHKHHLSHTNGMYI